MKRILYTLLGMMLSMGAWAQNVAKIGEAEYATLADAITEATDGQTVTVTADCSISSEILVEKTVNLDLNGKTVTTNNCSAFQVKGGKLNLTGSEGSKIVGSPSNYKLIYLYGSPDASATDYSVVNVGENVTVDCTNGYAVMLSANGNSGYGVKVTVDGTATGAYGGLYVNGNITKTDGNVPVFTVGEKANIVSTGGTAIYAAGYAEWNIAGNVTGKDTGIEVRAGKLNVTGGTIIGNGEVTNANPNGNGTTSVGAGIAVAQHTTKLPIDVKVSGGTIKGYTAFYQIDAQSNGEEALNKISLEISGGTFEAINGGTNAVYSENKSGFVSGGTFSSAVPEGYCAEGFKPTDDGNGHYGVAEKNYVAEVGDKKYESLSEAIAAANDGDEITLLDEITISENLIIPKSVGIDLNGNNINANAMIYVNGDGKNVAIKDSKATEAPAVGADHNVTYSSGKITTAESIFYIYNNATLTLASGTLESTGSYPIYIDDDNAAFFVMNDGYVHGAEFAISLWASTTVNINGGVVKSDDQAAIAGNGSAQWSTEKGTTVNVTGGTIIAQSKTTGDISCGIYNPQAGVVNISGGTIYADNGAGVVMRAGDLNVTGGKIVTTGNGKGLVGDAKNVVPMSAVVVDVDAEYPCNTINDLGVAITGGTFTSADGVDAISILNEKGIKATNDVVSVSGATLSGPIYTTETFSMTDDNAPYAFDNYRVKKAEYTREGVSETTWGTVCLPFSITAAENEYKYYIPESVTSDVLTITEITEFPIAAGTPVIFQKGAGDVVISSAEATVNKTATAGSGTGSLALVGTFENKTITSGLESIYFINGDKFHQAKASLTVPAYRAYIKNTSAGAKAAVLNIVVDGDATAIEGVAADMNTATAIYDVNGRQLSAPQKGINIMKLANGKTVKLIIK